MAMKTVQGQRLIERAKRDPGLPTASNMTKEADKRYHGAAKPERPASRDAQLHIHTGAPCDLDHADDDGEVDDDEKD